MESTGNVAIDAQNDVTALVTEAREGATAEVASAAALVDKLLSGAASDLPVLLTEEEQNAVPLVLSHVPSLIRGTVADAIEKTLAGNAYQGVFTADVMRALAIAQAEIANIQAHADRAIATL